MLALISTRWLAVGAALSVSIAAGVLFELRSRGAPNARRSPKIVLQPAAAIVDPLEPDRPLQLREQLAPDASALMGAPGSDHSWVGRRPLPALREDLKPEARGGIDPCDTPNANWGKYTPGRVYSGFYVAMPKAPPADGKFDVVLHFHGHEIALKEFVRADTSFVMLGMSETGYAQRLAGPKTLDLFVDIAERAVSDHAKKPVKVRRVTLAAWSGGYEAIKILLGQSERVPDAVILLDGLHGSRDQALLADQLEPFVRYARRAVKNEGFMFVSHSSVDTDGYASSTEGSHYLVHALGGRPLAVERKDLLGMRLVELYSSGSMHVRGYAGGGKRDHCAHLSLYPLALHALEKRWR